MRALESDIARAISGGSEEQVAETIRRVQEADVERPTAQTLQKRIEEQAAGIQSEITSLQEEQATAEAATDVAMADINANLAFQQGVVGGIESLAAGTSQVITATGPQQLDPYQQFLMTQAQAQKTDAFQAIVTAFKNYGIEDIADTVFALMSDPTIGENQAIYKMKFDTTINPSTGKPWNEAYSRRFAANTQRIKEGKPALSESEYLTAERTYARVLQGLGVSRLATRSNFNKFIAGDVSADEVADRVNIAVSRIENAPRETKDALARFYPNLSVLDVAEAVLDPEITLPALRRRVAAAEIGGGAIGAGLGITRERAEELGALGVTAAGAREGFQAVAQVMPGARRLSDIYRESLTQQDIESEVFKTAGAAEAKRRRESLVQRETAAFSGRSGAAQGALGRERAGGI
jgi:hypothetical protein